MTKRRRMRRSAGRRPGAGPTGLWRDAARHAVLGLAAAIGPAAVAVVQWWLATR